MITTEPRVACVYGNQRNLTHVTKVTTENVEHVPTVTT